MPSDVLVIGIYLASNQHSNIYDWLVSFVYFPAKLILNELLMHHLTSIEACTNELVSDKYASDE